MKLGVLDGHALNPGDLTWEPLKQLGELSVFPITGPEKVLERVQAFDAVFTNKVAFGKEVLSKLPQLRYIGVMATGYDKIDTAVAREQGVVVTNVAGYSTPSVAQHVFALLLELTNRVGEHSQSVSAGEWNTKRGWSYWKQPIVELSGLTLGIIGMGDIGQQVARIGHAFGMSVIYHTRSPKSTAIGEAKDLEEVLCHSDVLSLHCPLTDNTHHIIDTQRLALMKPSAFLINTGRGQLIDAVALKNALENKEIAGAGLDVLSQEPPKASHPLINLPNCLITPHNAWGSLASRQRLLDEVVLNFKSFLEGRSRNVVN